MTAVPRLVIAAPCSGAGKTTVATGLMAAWRQAGLVVSPHKVGPDYIDRATTPSLPVGPAATSTRSWWARTSSDRCSCTVRQGRTSLSSRE